MVNDWFNATINAATPNRHVTLLPELEPYWQRWSSPEAQAAMIPLRVAVEVTGIMAGYNPLNLDNLLARLVVDRAFSGNQLDDTHSPYLLPAPLKIMWRHPQTGHPLYASNAFTPVGHNQHLTVWWHKRFVRPELARAEAVKRKGDIQPSQGRYKEKRTPLPAQTASVWYADCIGDADSIAELLRLCNRIGKRRMASVEEWCIGKIEAFEYTRPVPVPYRHPNGDLPIDMQYCGWTPPYWPGVPESQGWCI